MSLRDRVNAAIRKRVLDTVSDGVGRLLYYDRKEDEELPRGAIDDAVRIGVITVDEIVAEFRSALEKGLKK